MGDKITLRIQARTVRGKKVAQLRREGLTPGVVYGAGFEAVAVQASAQEVAKVVQLAGQHTPVHLTGSKRRIAMIKQVDRHPVKQSIRHVAFHAVKANKPVIAEVPIRLVGHGESVAEKIIAERETEPFLSLEDLTKRTKLNKTVLKLLQDYDCVKGIQEENQSKLF